MRSVDILKRNSKTYQRQNKTKLDSESRLFKNHEPCLQQKKNVSEVEKRWTVWSSSLSFQNRTLLFLYFFTCTLMFLHINWVKCWLNDCIFRIVIRYLTTSSDLFISWSFMLSQFVYVNIKNCFNPAWHIQKQKQRQNLDNFKTSCVYRLVLPERDQGTKAGDFDNRSKNVHETKQSELRDGKPR